MIIIWGKNQNHPLNVKICENAVSKGYLNILKWAVKNFCPWDRLKCLRIAKNYKCFSIINWIKYNTK
jgi:hypothetical protein